MASETKGSSVKVPKELQQVTCAAAVMRYTMSLEQEAAVRAAIRERRDPTWVHITVQDVASVGCAACGGTAEITKGQLESPKCLISGSCEEMWSRLYPENYVDETGEPIANGLPCAGPRCPAVMLFSRSADGGGVSRQVFGTCWVERAGMEFWSRGRLMLLGMKPAYDIERQMEPYDGATWTSSDQ